MKRRGCVKLVLLCYFVGPFLLLLSYVAIIEGAKYAVDEWLHVQPEPQAEEQSSGSTQNERFTHQDHELRCRSKYNPNWGPCWRI